MLDKKVRDLINAQIAKEFYSGYLYLDFANFYEEKGLYALNQELLARVYTVPSLVL